MLAEGAGHWSHLRARSLRQPGYCPPSRLTPRTSPEAPADSTVVRCHAFVDLMLFFIGLVARRGTLLPTRLPRWHGRKESACQCRRHKRCRLHPWVRKMPWRRAWHPTPVSLPGEPQGQRSLAGCSPWGCRESGMAKHTPVSGRHLPKCDLRAGVASISPQSPQGPLPPPLPCSHAPEFRPFRLNCGVIPQGRGEGL